MKLTEKTIASSGIARRRQRAAVQRRRPHRPQPAPAAGRQGHRQELGLSLRDRRCVRARSPSTSPAITWPPRASEPAICRLASAWDTIRRRSGRRRGPMPGRRWPPRCKAYLPQKKLNLRPRSYDRSRASPTGALQTAASPAVAVDHHPRRERAPSGDCQRQRADRGDQFVLRSLSAFFAWSLQAGAGRAQSMSWRRALSATAGAIAC